MTVSRECYFLGGELINEELVESLFIFKNKTKTLVVIVLGCVSVVLARPQPYNSEGLQQPMSPAIKAFDNILKLKAPHRVNMHIRISMGEKTFQLDFGNHPRRPLKKC